MQQLPFYTITHYFTCEDRMSKRILKEVHPDKHFWLANGKAIKNLHELRNSLQQMDDAIFGHHVNDEKHDFHNWVRDIHQDEKLASAMLQHKHRKGVLYEVATRIKEVEAAVVKISKGNSPKKKVAKKVVNKKKAAKIKVNKSKSGKVRVTRSKNLKNNVTKNAISRNIKKIKKPSSLIEKKPFNFNYFDNLPTPHKIEAVAIISAVLLCAITIGLGSKAATMTGAAVTIANEVQLLSIGGVGAIVVLLFIVLHAVQVREW